MCDPEGRSKVARPRTVTAKLEGYFEMQVHIDGLTVSESD